MLGWGLISLIVALIAAILGFGAENGPTVEIARLVFQGASALFIASALARVVRGNR
jgi:uncharacterized membrane protein YtjA (UPF0391 family)